MIEPDHLDILVRVGRGETLSQVAAELYRTQPTITHAIRKLETLLGAPVWRRHGRGVQLTAVGRHIAARGESILADLWRLEDEVAGLAAGRLGTLRIGVECHPCFDWLTRVVGGFLRTWREVDLDVVRGVEFAGYAPLLDRRIDVLITPDPRPHDHIDSVAVLPYRLVLAVSRDHPLSDTAYVTAADLVSETLFTYPVDRSRLDIFTALLDPANVEPRRVEAIETTEIMLELVAAGRGVTALPDWLVAETPHLTGVRIGPDGIAKTLVASYRDEDAGLAYLQAFIAGLR